jgi:hypothetical protein
MDLSFFGNENLVFLEVIIFGELKLFLHGLYISLYVEYFFGLISTNRS